MSAVIAQAITEATAAFRGDPLNARATFKSESQLTNGFRSEVRIREHSLTVDEPTRIGGTNDGPTPVELVLAALGTCQEITYRAFATALDIPLEHVAVTVEGDIDFRGFFAIDPKVRPGFDAIRVTVNLTSSASAAEQARLREMVNRHCPVLDMLTRPVPVTFP
ncbi:MAG: OsmC family peroxiredoxin [Gammaproteobacteria bacterium]|nr:OsmC family peroxiredoxin [Gammaproteobacteria bacterium]